MYLLLIDSQNTAIVYAGFTVEGIFKSTDAGNSWSTFNVGLRHLEVYILAMDPQNSAKIYAGTGGGGVYELMSRSSWDIDADGKSDITVWRQHTGVWYSLPSNPPGTYTAQQW